MRVSKVKPVLAVLAVLAGGAVFGQTEVNLSGQMNVISTAVPFLNISPDSRAGAMGDAGVASLPDFNSQAWNPSKYAFLDEKFGVGVSFTPWLRHLVNDINMYYLTGFYRLDDLQSVSASLRYFSVGSILIRETIDDNGYEVQPNEFAFDVAYHRKLSNKFAGSVAFRYIRSDLSASKIEGMEAGNSFASDVSFFFKQPLKKGKLKSDITAGVNISNIGTKISYDGVNKEFIPTNLKIGAGYHTEIDEYNALSFVVDFNKLLVPTPSLVANNEADYADENKDVSVISGMFKSFGDAPGGFKEELHEISVSAGAEYWYAKQFALRAGYFHEHETKGNRKYVTAGAGLKFNIFNIDASYIIPMESNNPLANTIRFSLAFNLSDL
ncbi:MAG: type IX secretion system outer membrane channel protein PorV [Breznakibacter sp.]